MYRSTLPVDGLLRTSAGLHWLSDETATRDLSIQGAFASIQRIDNGRYCMNLPDAPIAHDGFFATHFLTVRDQEKSKDFYVRILGGKVIKAENPCYIKLANTWIILNSGGGPTPDKPEVLLETPSDLKRVNSF